MVMFSLLLVVLMLTRPTGLMGTRELWDLLPPLRRRGREGSPPSMHRAMEFVGRVQAGVVAVNGATYGSEPHMPFGGLGDSCNGSREPGTEALDVYSELKDIYLTVVTGRL